MAVWDVPDDMVDSVAESFTRNPHVTLCYRRPRHLPLWPYNIFCMVHAKARQDAYAVIDEINLLATRLEQAGGAVLDALLQAARRGVLQCQAGVELMPVIGPTGKAIINGLQGGFR